MRIDFHTHVIPTLPGFAEQLGDPRWPSFEVDGTVGRLSRGGRVVRTVPPSAWSAAARVEDMDAAGIDRQVLSPIPPVVCDWDTGAAAADWSVRLNESIASMVAERPDRFSGLGTVPLQDPAGATAVLCRARESGLDGVEIGTTAGGVELDHPDLHEFFAEAARLGMLVFVHPLILGAVANWTTRITGAEVTFGLGMPTDTAIAATKLVFGGVVEKYPDLRICLAHGGGGFAWALTRIARLWDAGHDRSARELARNVYVDSVVYEPANLVYLRDVLGADRIVFGTDYPLPAQDDMAGAALARLDGTEADQVWGRNAGTLLSCC